MAYKCDGSDAANKMPKYKRTKTGAGLNYSFLIQTVRIINTGVRITGGGGTVRPATGQILPRGS